jgi:signal transduction histidine kinase
MKIGLKLKLSIFLALLLLTSLSILSFFVLRGIHNNQIQENESYLIQQGEIASNYMKQIYLLESENTPDTFLRNRAQELVTRLDMISGMQVILYDMSGEKIMDSRPLAGHIDADDLMKYALLDKDTYEIAGDTMVFLAPLRSSKEQIGVLQFNYSISKDRIFYTHIKRLFLYSGLIIFTAFFICGYFYMNSITRVIKQLKNTTHRIQEGDYKNIQGSKRRDELGELGDNILFMGARIQSQFEKMQEEQQNLSLAVEKLEVLGTQQKEFIGNVSHEFKTPLTVIKAYTDLMFQYHEDPVLLNDAQENINKEIQRLTKMLEKVLNLSALEKYDFELHKEETDIAELLHDTCNRMLGRAQKYGLQLHIETENNIIITDKEIFMQIMMNLIDNAIKYNRPQGHVWVTSGKEDDSLLIKVKDTGIGIPIAERDKIFQPYYKGDKTTSESTGLGLALVKGLVGKLGGSIRIYDNQKEGTVFEIRFPSI